MNVEKKEITRVVENEYIITLNEEQAMILTLILGKIGGIHRMAAMLVNPLYNELQKNIGAGKVYRFLVDNENTFESTLWFKGGE